MAAGKVENRSRRRSEPKFGRMAAWSGAARVRRDAAVLRARGRWRERHGGRRGGERKNVLALARQPVESDDRMPLVDSDDACERNGRTGHDGNRGRAASGSRARTTVPGLVVGWSGALRSVVVSARRAGRRRSAVSANSRIHPGHLHATAVRGAAHDPLRLAEEQREPERERERENAAVQRTSHPGVLERVRPTDGRLTANNIRQIRASSDESFNPF